MTGYEHIWKLVDAADAYRKAADGNSADAKYAACDELLAAAETILERSGASRAELPELLTRLTELRDRAAKMYGVDGRGRLRITEGPTQVLTMVDAPQGPLPTCDNVTETLTVVDAPEDLDEDELLPTWPWCGRCGGLFIFGISEHESLCSSCTDAPDAEPSIVSHREFAHRALRNAYELLRGMFPTATGISVDDGDPDYPGVVQIRNAAGCVLWTAFPLCAIWQATADHNGPAALSVGCARGRWRFWCECRRARPADVDLDFDPLDNALKAALAAAGGHGQRLPGWDTVRHSDMFEVDFRAVPVGLEFADAADQYSSMPDC